MTTNGHANGALPYADKDLPRLDSRFAEIKKIIIKPENVDEVRQSYARLLVALQKEADRIKSLARDVIPQIQWSEIAANGDRLPSQVLQAARESGCLIVRGVIDRQTAIRWKDELRAYCLEHPKNGRPSSIWPYHWTRPQMQSRSHPDTIRVVNAVSMLWHPASDQTPVDLSSHVVYSDRFRIRYPEDGEGTLPPHQDNGSVERWEDPTYRKYYAKIFEGTWEEFDPWMLDDRVDANIDMYRDSPCQSGFRSLQGWLALSQTNVGEGTLRLVPKLKLVTAYIMLRPYFMQGSDAFDDASSVFPGCVVKDGQFYPTEQFHPHLRLQDTMLNIPPIEPGDFVFWHCDQVHDVDRIHRGPKGKDSSVIYIPVAPLCDENIKNMMHHRTAFEQCKPIDDFPNEAKNIKDGVEAQHVNHGARRENIMTEEGLRALGLAPFDVSEHGLSQGARTIRERANSAMKA